MILQPFFFLLLFSSFWLFSNEHTTFEQLPNTHTSNQHKSKIDRTQLITWNIFCTCYYYGQIRWKKIRTHKSMVTWENSWKLAECLLKPKVFWFEGKVIRFHNNQCIHECDNPFLLTSRPIRPTENQHDIKPYTELYSINTKLWLCEWSDEKHFEPFGYKKKKENLVNRGNERGREKMVQKAT